MSKELKISIVTACFNSEATIEDAIATLKDQKWCNVEHIIIDGLSKDATVDISRKALAEGDVLVSEKDQGIYDALNKGIQYATGDIIGFLHSDDLFARSDVLSRVAECFNNSNTNAVYGDLEYVNASNTDKVVRYWKSGSYSRRKMKWGWMPPHPTFFMRRELYEELGGFNLDYHISGDYDLLLRYLCSERMRVAYIPEVLVKMRVGGASNGSMISILRKMKEDADIMRKNKINPFLALPGKNLSKLPQFFSRRKK